MQNGIKNSYDYIADEVRKYWKNDYIQDVVAFFWQKYDYETDSEWEWHEEVVFCKSDSNYTELSFLCDFCEGQTCVKDVVIVPLSEVTEYYAETKLLNDKKERHDMSSERMRMGTIKPNNTDIEYVCARCSSSTHVDWRDVKMRDDPSGLKGEFHCPICGYRVSVDLKPLPKKVAII